MYPLATFYTYEEAWCTLKNMQDVQGGSEELEVARMACLEPGELAPLLLPQAKAVESLMRTHHAEMTTLNKK